MGLYPGLSISIAWVPDRSNWKGIYLRLLCVVCVCVCSESAKKQEAETEELEEQFQEELRRLKSVQEEKTRLRAEVEDFQHRLDEEKHRSAELLLQVWKTTVSLHHS